MNIRPLKIVLYMKPHVLDRRFGFSARKSYAKRVVGGIRYFHGY